MIITASGKLSRTNYWKDLLVGVLGFLIVAGILYWLLDVQNAEVAGASTLNQVFAVIIFILYAASIIFFIAFVTTVLLRRARDAGNTVLWTLVGIFIPFGVIVLGLILSRK